MVTRTSIFEHIIRPREGNLPADLAKYLLTLEFPGADQAHYATLAEKAQAGALSAEEKSNLDDFLSVDDFLSIMHAKAHASLSNGSHAA